MPAINETWTYSALGLVDTHGLPFAGANPNVTASVQYTSGLPTRLLTGAQVLVNSAEYSPAGGLSKWTAGNGVVTTIEQDLSLMPRPRRISTSGFDTGVFSYDGAGNITGIGSDLFAYDARSRMVSGLGQSFQYDRFSNLSPSSVSPLTNRLTSAAYDERGNLLRSGNQNYRYDELSRQIALDGGKERYLYDGAGERIARITSTAPGLSYYTITPCRVRDTRDPPGAPLTPWVPFPVQVAGSCAIPLEAEAVAGNLTVLGSTQPGFIAAQPAGTSGLDTTTINFSAGQTRANNFSLGLSTSGQLALTASTAVHAILDASGYYAYAGPASQETWNLTLRDEGNRLSTDYSVTSSGTTRKRSYFYFGNLLVATRDDGPPVAWRYYSSDHLGTPRVVTSSTGSVLETHTYRPFGEEVGGTFGLQPLKFAAMERDLASGNDYNHARYQSSTLGRFLSPDVLGGKPEDPQTWNRYAYARNNPLKFVDPDGKAFDIFIDVVSIGYDIFDIGRSVARGESISGTQVLALGADVVGAAVPFVTGAGAAVRAAARSGEAATALRVTKAVNLPSWRAVTIDVEHIASGHMKGGSRISDAKALFPEHMSKAQVEKAVREAYRFGQKITTQGDRVLVEGVTRDGLKVRVWLNKLTKRVETAFPVF